MAHIEFFLNGAEVTVESEQSLLDALRGELGVTSPKDGCSPQGQCGCCTVWIDGVPRVACVTPVQRVSGRSVTTIEGLADAQAWADTFVAHGASQCGFCTPGIIMRLAAIATSQRNEATVRRALLAHLCRCTGWQPIVDAALAVGTEAEATGDTVRLGTGELAERRAQIEGRVPQQLGAATVLGRGGFADDTAPADALVALRSTDGVWKTAPTVAETRVAIGKVQGRRTTTQIEWPVSVPEGTFDRVLQTTWTEPGYLEPDASWCQPGGQPASSIGNGGAFGAKTNSPVGSVARDLADAAGQTVRALYSREDAVRLGPKRPPVAIGMNADGSGVVRVAVAPGDELDLSALRHRWPQMRFETVEVAGPPTSLGLRAAVEAELWAVKASFQPGPEYSVSTDDGATATATVTDAAIEVHVECGDPLDPVVLTSYCSGAAHMAFSLVTTEAIRLDGAGVPTDLTIRSFGICRAADTPTIQIDITPSARPPINGSDAVFAAVAAATWAANGHGARWPTKR